MALTIQAGDYIAKEDLLYEGSRVVPVWVPKAGLTVPGYPDYLYSMKRLCSVAEISDISPEFVNERDAFEAGKSRTSVNDGVKWTFSITGLGNALALQAALVGQSLSSSPGIRQGQQFTAHGDLILLSAGPSFNAEFSTYIPDVTVKLGNVPGVTDGESSITIDLETSSTPIRFGPFVMPVREIWKGTVGASSNANAPDGTATTFTLGTGNLVGVGGTPATVAWDPNDALNRIVKLKVNGTVETGFTFDEGTSIITMATAPADEAILEAFYCVRIGAPDWTARSYGINSVVKGSDGVYYTNASAVATASDNPINGAPWAAYTGFGIGGSATPIIPYTSGEGDFRKSWDSIVT